MINTENTDVPRSEATKNDSETNAIKDDEKLESISKSKGSWIEEHEKDKISIQRNEGPIPNPFLTPNNDINIYNEGDNVAEKEETQNQDEMTINDSDLNLDDLSVASLPQT